jgi:hypothetical protein
MLALLFLRRLRRRAPGMNLAAATLRRGSTTATLRATDPTAVLRAPDATATLRAAS